MKPAILAYIRRYAGKERLTSLLVLFAAYVGTAELGSHIYGGYFPAVIWPPAGIALSLLFLQGLELWPAVTAAAFVTMFLKGAPLPLACFIALGSTLQTLAGAALLRSFDFEPMLARLQDTFSFITITILTAAITPTIGILGILLVDSGSLSVVGLLEGLPGIWWSWWLGEMLSILILAPFLMRWLARWPTKRSTGQLIEWGVSFFLLVCIFYFLFWTPFTQLYGIPLIYLIFIPLIWMSLRIGPRGMTLALLLMTVISLTGTLWGSQMSSLPIGVRLFQIEMFDGILSVIFLIFVSSEEGRKEATKALESHVDQLEDALRKISSEDQAKNEFLAILAHELRNPLAPILSSLELLKLRGPGARGAPQLIETMDDRVRTMSRLLDDLLDISRISQKKFKLKKEVVDLAAIVKLSARTVESLMQSRGHTLHVSVPKNPLWISADPVRVEQILVNLLTNAAKYTEKGGTIHASCARENTYAVISVRDTGIGIARDMLGRIFEPFQQADRGGNRTEGLGIGLSLTRRLVEMHQGSVEARSRGLGHGSEFVVRLPIPPALQLPIPAAPKARKPRAAVPSNFKILVVDDNRAAAEGLGKLLEYKGHTVTLAYTGQDACDTAAQFNPDVIVLDIGLPDMNGYAVAQKLRNGMHSNAFLIALTGYGQEEDKERARKAGFDYHLTKPVGVGDVEAVLTKMPRVQ